MRRRIVGVLLSGALAGATLTVLGAGPASSAITVSTEAAFRAAWGNAAETEITLAADITLVNCGIGEADRNSATALTVLGNGHTIRQTCAGARVLFQGGTGDLTFDGVTITGATASGLAGGGVRTNGAVTLTNSTVTGNTADSGGGISASGAFVTVTNSTVSANQAPSVFGNGGGIFAQGAVTLTNSTVSGNTANSAGGGVFANSSSTVTNSTLSDNHSNTSVGGGMLVPNGDITLTNSTVSGNTASHLGGGVAALDVNLVYATVVGNTAPTGANIEILSFDSISAFGSVVALPEGGGANCAFQPPPVTISSGFNFSDDDSCGFTNTAQGDRQNAGDPGLGALADNGGPTQTRLPQPGSPLIDAIPSASCQDDGAAGITADQRGVTRPQQGGCDIGAVEVTPPPPPPPPPVPPPVPLIVTPTFTG